jgi:hypothetical protein
MGKVIPTTSFRRVSAPDPAVVEAFVRLDNAPGETAVPAPIEELRPAVSTEPAATPPPLALAPAYLPDAQPKTAAPVNWRRKTLRRADGRELRKQTFYLDAELSHRLMVTCAASQYDLSEAIEEAVNLWLKGR